MVNWPSKRDSSADAHSSVSPSSERGAKEGPTLETSALESLYDGQFTFNSVDKPNIRFPAGNEPTYYNIITSLLV